MSLAFKSLKCLLDKHSNYAKTPIMHKRFSQHWASLSDEDKKNDFSKDERIRTVVTAQIENIVKMAPKIQQLKSEASLEGIRESIKYDLKLKAEINFEELEKRAVTALVQ